MTHEILYLSRSAYTSTISLFSCHIKTISHITPSTPYTAPVDSLVTHILSWKQCSRDWWLWLFFVSFCQTYVVAMAVHQWWKCMKLSYCPHKNALRFGHMVHHNIFCLFITHRTCCFVNRKQLTHVFSAFSAALLSIIDMIAGNEGICN